MNPQSKTLSSSGWQQYWKAQQSVVLTSTQGRLASHLTGQLACVEGLRMIELGCGAGTDGRILQKSGAFLVFVDFAPAALHRIRDVSHEPEDPPILVCADARSLPFREACLDVLLHQGLLEHYQTPGDILMENSRVLKPGGQILIDVPQRYHPYTLIKQTWIRFRRWPWGWETQYSPNQLRHTLEAHEFQPVSYYGCWSRPSLLYRLLRFSLLRLHIPLPLNPPMPSWISRLQNSVISAFSKQSWFLWTAMDIGALATKPADMDV